MDRRRAADERKERVRLRYPAVLALRQPAQDGPCMYFPGNEPQNLGKEEFYFDYQAAYGWCWHKHSSKTEFQTTAQLAEQIIKQLLRLHDRFEKGEIRRRGNW